VGINVQASIYPAERWTQLYMINQSNCMVAVATMTTAMIESEVG
jgi:hypothetical protein